MFVYPVGGGGLAVSIYVSFERKLSGTFIQSFDLSLPVECEKSRVSQERGGEFTAMRCSSLSSLNCDLFVIAYFSLCFSFFLDVSCQIWGGGGGAVLAGGVQSAHLLLGNHIGASVSKREEAFLV